MKINGEFIMREVVGEYILVPVGDTALHLNGIISMNEVSACIWKGLQEGKDEDELLESVLSEFEVSDQEAKTDLEEFLKLLREKKLIVS